MKVENAVIIRNESRLERLEKKFNTKAQAEFYIQKQKEVFEEQRAVKAKKSKRKGERVSLKQKSKVEVKSDFSSYEKEHDKFTRIVENVKRSLAKDFRIKEVSQLDLPYHLFGENDIVLVIGQDGLVANAAKYVGNLPIIAINPLPEVFDGVLLPFNEFNFKEAIKAVISNNFLVEKITMAQVELNDGQKLLAFNDFFVGVNNHASARYEIEFNGRKEKHSSSGIIISTGAGSTGWLSSIYNMANALSGYTGNVGINTNSRFSRESKNLRFVVREPFKSKHSQANLVVGDITPGMELIVESTMPENGVIFSDGIQSDFLNFNSGTMATFSVAQQRAHLVKNLVK